MAMERNTSTKISAGSLASGLHVQTLKRPLSSAKLDKASDASGLR
jgi:hypothetical protein